MFYRNALLRAVRGRSVRKQAYVCSLRFEALEPRQLLTGVTFFDTFANDTIGAAPAIQAGDNGLSWTDIIGTPNVGTGSASSGDSAPRNVDIGGSSQWVRFDGTAESATANFTGAISANGSMIEFDYHGIGSSSSTLQANSFTVSGSSGDLFTLKLSINDDSSPAEISLANEILVNDQATGVAGPSDTTWAKVTITLQQDSWDLTWQAYDTSGGETTTLTGPITTLAGMPYLTGAPNSATSITVTDDHDADGDDDGDGLMFVSNVKATDVNAAPKVLDDFVTTSTNAGVSFNVLSNDSDSDTGDVLSLVSFTQTANGTLVDNGLGNFSYTPNTGFTGADQFNYTTNDLDGSNGSATAYVYTSGVTGLPALATNPEAPAVIYLDFDGQSGNDPFEREGGLSLFTTLEQDLIDQSVAYLAEAFSIFDVNVTTVLTPDLPKAWLRIISDVSGGVALVGSFPGSNATGRVDSSDRNLSTASSHELGHIFGVTHQSTFDEYGVEINEYRGAVDGEAAIMGVDFAGNVVRWWLGLDHNEPQIQDDILDISNRIRNHSASTTGFASDEHGDIFSTATLASHDSGVWTANGVINQLDDVDFFSFNWTGGDVEIEALRPNSFTNSNRGDPVSVDLVESIYDFEGNLIAFADPDSFQSNAGLDARVIIPDLTAGTYYVSLASHGDYADVGVYDLTIQSGTWSGSNPSTNSLTAPRNFNVTQTTSSLASLTWSDISGESGYSIERSTNRVDFAEVATVGTDVTTYTDTGLENATQYFYRVRAIDGVTVSVASNIEGALTRPGAVEQLRVLSYQTGELILDWKAQVTSGESGFRIERSTDGVNFTPIATVGANTTNYFDDGLSINTTYDYRLVTLDAQGVAATSNIVSRSTRLTSVTNLTAVEGDSPTSVDLDWNGVGGATGYLIEVGVNGVDFQTVVANHATTSYTDTIISSSNVYTYRVTGLNADSKSINSATVDYVPPLTNLIVDSSFELSDGFPSLGADSAADLGTVTDNDGVIWSSTDGAELRRRNDIPDDGVQTLRIGNDGTESVTVQIPGTDQGIGTVQFGYSSQSTMNTGIGSLWYNDNAGSGWVEVWSNDFGTNNPMWSVKPWTTVSLGLNVEGDVDLEFRKNGNKAMFVDRVRVTSAPVVIADTSFESSEGFPLLNNGVLSDLGTVTDSDGVVWSSTNGADLFNRNDITADGLQVIQVNGNQSLNVDMPGTTHGVGTVSFGFASNSNFNTGTGSLWYNDNAGSGWVEAWSNDFNSNNPIWSNHPYTTVNVDINIGGDAELEFRYSGNKAILVDSVVITGLAEGEPADLNSDGKVDGLDLASWESVYGTTDTAAVPGDIDADNDADGADFLAWQRAVVPPGGGGFPPPRLVASYSTSESSQVGDTFAANSGESDPPLAAISMADAELARDVLLAGVLNVKVVGDPGRIAVFGGDAFSIVHDGEYHAIAAGALWGSGKVVAFGHEDYLDFNQHAGTLNTGQFYLNSIEWASGVSGTGVVVVTDNNDAATWLQGQGFTNVSVHSDWENHLVGTQALVVTLGDSLNSAQETAISGFVQGGGGLVTAGTGHSYIDLPNVVGNQALKGAGLGWAAGGRLDVTLTTLRATEYANAETAMTVLANPASFTTAQQREALIAATTATQVLPSGDSLLTQLNSALGPYTPTASNQVSDQTIQGILQWENDKLRNAEAEDLYIHRTANQWGLIDASVPRVNKNVSITPTSANNVWHSTGLYAAPGETITAIVGAGNTGDGLILRIGSHDDSITGRPSWARMPRIDSLESITSTSTDSANAYGGLVYIQVPSGLAATPISITIQGAVEAPYFVLGQTTDNDWVAGGIRGLEAPYAELASDNLIISLRSDVIRTLTDPTDLMAYWNGIVAAQDDLAGRPDPREHTERIDLDVQISAGFLHSGYPIAGVDSTGSGIVDLPSLEQFGTWGYFHELGHNHQNGSWTFNGMGEVTVNIFSMYGMDSVNAIPNSGWSDMWSATRRVERHQSFVGDGGDYDAAGAGDKLIIFAQLREAFGWDPYFKFFREYIGAPAEELPQNDQEERDQWLTRFSNIVGNNLTSLFDAWNFGVSQEARDAVAHLPDWSMVEMLNSSMELSTTRDTSVTTINLIASGNAFSMSSAPISVEGFTHGANGQITDNNDGTLTYTPDSGYRGYDKFTYTLNDTAGGSVTETVLVKVDNQVIVQTSFEPSDGFTGFPTGNHANLGTVVDNDGVTWSSTDGARIWNRSDIPPDGVQVLALGLVGNPTNSLIEIPGTTHGVGTVTFDHASFSTSTNADFSLWYDANDGNGFIQAWTSHFNGQNPSWANDVWPFISVPINVAGDVDLKFQVTGTNGMLVDTVIVTEFAGNTAPNAYDDAATTDQDVVLELDVLANDLDIDAQPLSIASFTQPTRGIVTDSGNGTLIYTPNPGDYGDDSFTYVASDGAGGMSTGSVDVAVTPITIVPGDVNLDSVLNVDDLVAFIAGWQSDTSGLVDQDRIRQGDLNTDGLTNLADAFLLHSAWAAQFGTSFDLNTLLAASVGDFNADGNVDTVDLNVWRTGFGQTVGGDTDLDGDSDGGDFLTWQRNFNAPPAVAFSSIVAVAAEEENVQALASLSEPTPLTHTSEAVDEALVDLSGLAGFRFSNFRQTAPDIAFARRAAQSPAVAANSRILGFSHELERTETSALFDQAMERLYATQDRERDNPLASPSQSSPRTKYFEDSPLSINELSESDGLLAAGNDAL